MHMGKVVSSENLLAGAAVHCREGLQMRRVFWRATTLDSKQLVGSYLTKNGHRIKQETGRCFLVLAWEEPVGTQLPH